MDEDDEWIQSAMKDDAVVASLLLRIRKSEAQPSLKRLEWGHLEWGAKQPRSSHVSRRLVLKKKGESTRASPTTPLSWSAGTSNSGGIGDDYEDCSLAIVRNCSDRSKVLFTGETGLKRSRKKKTFAELQEDEMFLKKEKLDLTKVDFPVEPANNKGISVDVLKKPSYNFPLCYNIPLSYNQSYQRETVSIAHTPTALHTNHQFIELGPVGHPLSFLEDSSKAETNTMKQVVLLPDLNLPLEEEESSPEILYGFS